MANYAKNIFYNGKKSSDGAPTTTLDGDCFRHGTNGIKFVINDKSLITKTQF